MNRNKKLAKGAMGMALAAMMLLSPLSYFGAETAYAATQYEMKTEKTVTRGVTYEKSSRMTDAGVQNVHVMKVDLTESTLEIREVESKGNYGLKETVKKMLTDNGAVAGVNADFFGLSGSYSAPFGPVVKDGEVVSAGTTLNKSEGQYAAFFMDEDGNPFFDYFTMTAKFGNEKKMLELAGLNKFASLVFPAYLDRNAMNTTSSLDQRFEKLVKFVVEDDEITYISNEGETVTVPEDGYVIVMSADYRKNAAPMFEVGDPVVLDINSSVDLDEMETAFGGGGKLLVYGKIVEANSKVATGRQPRTAFGVSRDGNTAIFMVVDGRGDSIGATHWELGLLMQEYGAYEAMHLDGGGSSTMVAKTAEDKTLTVQNEVSEGSERKVINAVGIFQNAKQGKIEEIRIQPSATRTLAGREITFTVYGLDQYYNRIEIPAANVQMEALGVNGTWDGYIFTPSTTGTFTVTATYNGMGAYHVGAVSSKVARLKPANDSIKLNVGDVATIAMTAYDEDGFMYWASTSTKYSVGNPAVGTMKDNVFTAKAKGSTNIRCEKDGAIAYITVTVGGAETAKKPEVAAAKDVLNQTVTKKNDGAYYFNVAGKIAYTGTEKIAAETYNAARSKVKSYVDTNANVAIYGGLNDIQSAKKLDSLSWNGSYRFLNRGGVSLAMINAGKGGITATDATQWAKFTTDIENAGNDTIVLVMNQTPSDFTSAAEANYLRAVLNKYVEQGKKVFVISCYNKSYWTSTKDGVRYINLPNLWQADGTVNPNYTMLRFRVKDGNVTYEAVNIK
ncbi:MAG: phosphodiester glycosidase family protein [Anaerotignum sp.]|nr:phosphodiester glycosidase family protein [Anaerotignum sp.]